LTPRALNALAGETKPRIYFRRQIDELSNAAARGGVPIAEIQEGISHRAQGQHRH
jgi:hypothetical protein